MRDTLIQLRERVEEINALLEAAEDQVKVTVVVKLSVPGNRKRAYINGKRVPFHGDVGTVEVAPGTYRLIWDVQGDPGTSYVLGILEPSGAAFEKTFDIDGDGSDGGTWKFTV